jgi:hypothetical protein
LLAVYDGLLADVRNGDEAVADQLEEAAAMLDRLAAVAAGTA